MVLLMAFAPQVSADVPADGPALYEQHCARCHDPGLSNLMQRAPRKGSDYWSRRLDAVGYDTLLANTIGGVGRMPAQAGEGRLTDAQAAAALDALLGKPTGR